MSGFRTVYFARPVDQSDGPSPVTQLAELALDELRGCLVFDPAGAWRVTKDTPPNRKLQAVNLAVLDHCDALLVAYPDHTPSVGVWIEVQRALADNKDVFIVTDVPESWTLAWLAAQGAVVFNLNEADESEVSLPTQIASLVNAT